MNHRLATNLVLLIDVPLNFAPVAARGMSFAEPAPTLDDEAGRSMSEVSICIASTVEEPGATSREISHSVQQAVQGTAEVSVNVSGVMAAAQQAGSAAHTVLELASDLAKIGDLLRHEADTLLREVRACTASKFAIAVQNRPK